MHSNGGLGGGMGSDGDVDVLAQLVADAEGIADAARAAQVREVRLLAAAGQLAESQAAGSSEKVKAREMALRGIAAELAGVFVTTDRTLQRRIDEARDLVENYPVTMAAWKPGGSSADTSGSFRRSDVWYPWASGRSSNASRSTGARTRGPTGCWRHCG
ncbi:hypothetical protein ACLBWJ_00625 [Microbacterium sp. M4A5_1d]